MDTEKIVRENIDNILHMSLATCVNNIPWACEVHFAYDADLNLYFRSRKSTRHTREIAANPNVSGTIIKQYSLGESCIGIYFDGQAEQLENITEQDAAYQTLAHRQKISPAALEEALEENGHKFYKITVTNWYIFGRFGGPSGQKYQLSWNEGKK